MVRPVSNKPPQQATDKGGATMTAPSGCQGHLNPQPTFPAITSLPKRVQYELGYPTAVGIPLATSNSSTWSLLLNSSHHLSLSNQNYTDKWNSQAIIHRIWQMIQWIIASIHWCLDKHQHTQAKPVWHTHSTEWTTVRHWQQRADSTSNWWSYDHQKLARACNSMLNIRYSINTWPVNWIDHRTETMA
jgi:hypothetical protein